MFSIERYGAGEENAGQEDKVANERLLKINQFVSKRSKRERGDIENEQEKCQIEQNSEPKTKRREKKNHTNPQYQRNPLPTLQNHCNPRPNLQLLFPMHNRSKLSLDSYRPTSQITIKKTRASRLAR